MKLNLTGRAARWSAGHWKTACLGWLAFVAVAVAIGATVGNVDLTDAEQSTGQTAQAETILANAGFKQVTNESVLISSRRPLEHRARRSGARSGAPWHGCGRCRWSRPSSRRSTRPTRIASRRTGSRRSSSSSSEGRSSTAEDRVAPVLAAVAAVQRTSPGFAVSEYGDASSNLEFDNSSGKDFQRAEQLTLPLTFLILLLAFGAFVAAAVPVLLAFSAVLASIGLSELSSHVWHASDSSSSVILLIGMAVGVDYSLFYVKREREERRQGHGDDAVVRAGATSGNAVLISGATVLIAMAGMLLSGSKIFTSIGISAMLVVASAMIGSLTVLPALLGKLGNRDRPRRPRGARGSAGRRAPARRRRVEAAGAAARAAHVAAAVEGRARHVTALGRRAAAGAPAPVARRRLRGVGAGRPGAADTVHPDEAARVRRHAAEHPGRPHLLADPEGVPGNAGAGRGRGQGGRRRRSGCSLAAWRRCAGRRSRAALASSRSRRR